MHSIFDADQHRMLFYNQPIACWPSGMALQNTYLIRSDLKTHVNFNAVASAKLLLPHVLQSPTKPCIKTECKIRKTKRLPFPSLSELSLISGGKNMTAKGAHSSCPGWHWSDLHTPGDGFHREQRSPGTMTGHTCWTYTLLLGPDLFMRLR